MKINKLLLILVAMAAVSCSPDEKEVPQTDVFRYHGKNALQLSPDVPSKFSFETNLPWHIEVPGDVTWLDIDPESGDPKGETSSFEVSLVASGTGSMSTTIKLVIESSVSNKKKEIKVSYSALPPCTVSYVTDDMIFSSHCAGRTSSVCQGFDFSADHSMMFYSQVTSGHRNTLSWGPREQLSTTTETYPYMTLYYFSHANNIHYEKGADGADYLWLGNYGTRNSENGYTSPQILSKVKLVKNAKVKNYQADDNYYFGIKNLHASFDVAHDQLAIYSGGAVKVYRLSDVLKVPVTDVTLESELTYGGEGAPDAEYTGKPTIKAHDCRTLTPIYSFKYSYSPKGWQTFCISGDRAYFFLNNGDPVGGLAYRSVLEIVDFKGNVLKPNIFQPFADNIADLSRYGYTDDTAKYMENEGIIIRDGVMYMMYTAKNAAGIRRPVVFNLAVPE